MASKFRFVKRDIGKSNRPKGQTGDCTVRALATAAGLSYASAWKLLYDAQGRHKVTCFQISLFLKVEPETFGAVKQLDFPAKAGSKRMTAVQFAELHPTGSYILRMAGHVAAMEDGVLYDRWNCSRKCIYTAWKIETAKGTA